MALTSFDKYSIYARLVPALIVLLPVGLSIVCLFPQKFIGWDLLVWLGTSCGMAVFIEQLARDRGKKKEPELFEMWGGKPTTVMLRHKDSVLGRTTLERYHQKLTSLLDGTNLPSAEDEEKNPEHSDQIYDSCVTFLRTRTRDKKKFNMIFAENVNYGFRRNLWGMKPHALIFIILSIAVALTQVHPNWLNPGQVKPVVFVALILDISFLVVWIFQIKPDWVRTAADAYAMQLLAACDQL